MLLNPKSFLLHILVTVLTLAPFSLLVDTPSRTIAVIESVIRAGGGGGGGGGGGDMNLGTNLRAGSNMTRDEARDLAGAAQLANSSMFNDNPLGGTYQATYNPFSGGYGVGFYADEIGSGDSDSGGGPTCPPGQLETSNGWCVDNPFDPPPTITPPPPTVDPRPTQPTPPPPTVDPRPTQPTPPPPTVDPRPTPPPPPPPPSVSVSVSPNPAWPNQPVTITWSSSGASSCTASGDWSGSQPTSGSQQVRARITPGTNNFSLSCSGPGGTTTSGATVTVLEPTVAISAERVLVRGGGSTTISWDIEPSPRTNSDATCSITGVAGSPYDVTTTSENSVNTGPIDNGRIVALTCVIYDLTYTDNVFIDVVASLFET